MRWRCLLRGLLFIASLVVLGVVLDALRGHELFTKAWIDAEVRGQGGAGDLLFVAAGALFTAVGLPRQAVAFLGGYAFGLLSGTLLALLAAVLGCILAFYYARWLGRAVVMRRLPGRIQRLDAFIHDNPLAMTVLIRLLPVGSNLVVNLTAGVTSVGLIPFAVGSAIGYVPQTVVFALIGSGFNLDPVLRIGLGVALFVVSGVLGVYLYKRYRHGRSFDASLDRQVGAEPLATAGSERAP
jgi:uncharacterized membrane protein YdjX (TVP38/TMEM64 family)